MSFEQNVNAVHLADGPSLNEEPETPAETTLDQTPQNAKKTALAPGENEVDNGGNDCIGSGPRANGASEESTLLLGPGAVAWEGAFVMCSYFEICFEIEVSYSRVDPQHIPFC